VAVVRFLERRFRRGLKAVDPLAEEWHHIVRIGVAAEHRFLEDELAVQVDVEDSAGSSHELDAFEVLLPLLENPRRQTGGVRKRSSGNAVLDPYAVSLRHGRRIMSGHQKRAALASLVPFR